MHQRVAVVVTDGNAGIIDAYAADMSATVARSFRYFELLLVDNTGLGEVAGRLEDLLKQFPNMHLLKLSKRYAEEIAYTAALDHSIGDFVVSVDPDADPTALVPVFVHRCADGLDAVVRSSRPSRQRTRGASGSGARVLYRLLRAMTGYTIEPNTSHFCVLSRRVVNTITRIKDKEQYLKYLTAYMGCKHGTMAYERMSGAISEAARVVGVCLVRCRHDRRVRTSRCGCSPCRACWQASSACSIWSSCC